MSNLIQTIEAFIEKHGLSEWQFGEAAINDKHLIRQLRAGRDLRMSTVERLNRFMMEYETATAQG